ncbi:hypothetical protein CYR55_22275 [Chimaeribacter californicus]|uniref:Uncharacterized protein n=2 Tax=Chimaeribacter californicus TaxID=2060067 RepID=A0A2N5DUA9_9GAMM|nr:hypothetical protein CYR55_22275 [Chimaeribacter californicus]
MMNRWKRRDERAQAGHDSVTVPEAAGRPETTGLSGKTTGGRRGPVFISPSRFESPAHWQHDSQKPDGAALRMLAIIRRKGLGLFEQ